MDDLNPSQREAVAWDAGPILVLGGPSSGKASALTVRAARLLDSNPKTTLLGLTVTRGAAAKMCERLGNLRTTTDRLGISRGLFQTFQRFATQLLRSHGWHIGVRLNVVLPTEEDRLVLLEGVIANLPQIAGRVPSDRRNVLAAIDRMFSEAYGVVGESVPIAAMPDWLPLLFERYCEAMVSAKALDFGGLLYFATRLLRESEAVAHLTRRTWRNVCVAGFQHASRAHYELVRAMCPGTSPNLFVAGDDDRITDRWNGASSRLFDELRRDYDLVTVHLPTSYGCPVPIVALANRLVAHDGEPTKQEPPRWSDATAASEEVVAVRERPGRYFGAVRLEVLPSPEQEAEFVGRDIRERGLEASRCLVLGRSVRLIEQAAAVLSAAGHEASVHKGRSDFDSPIINTVVEALRLADSPRDRSSLGRLCAAWEELTGEVVDAGAAEAEAALAGGSLLREWAQLAGETSFAKIERLVQRIGDALVDRMAFLDVVDRYLDGEWRTWDGDGPDAATEKEVATWRVLHREIVADFGPSVTLREYVRQLDLAFKTAPAGPSALRCVTVHGSKGLVRPHVYLIGMAQEVYPTFHALRRGQDSRAMEEERRSCFVAVTRASETLTLTRSEAYYGHPKAPSQFLGEMGFSARHPDPGAIR